MALYLPLEVDFDEDDKVSRLSRYTKPGEARACRDLLVACWRYCKRAKSDGHVPLEQLGRLAYPDTMRTAQRDADRLVEVGLAERTDDGYYFPGYLKRNKSRSQLQVEAEAKAEAGRKGGLASGEKRRNEADSQADAKQSALQGASENEAGVLQTSEAIDRDRGKDKDKSFTSAGGERTETLRIVPASKPSPKLTSPEDARCTAHVGVAEPGPCKGCRAAREKAEKDVASDIEKQRREDERAGRNCDACDGTWIVDPATKLPTRRRCGHNRREST